MEAYVGIGDVVGEVDIDDGEAFFDYPFAVPMQGITLSVVSRHPFVMVKA